MRVANKFSLFLTIFVLYYLIPGEVRNLWQPDETRYAEISREMIVSGNWLVPHFFGLRYFEKPILGYWINSLGQLLFGHSNFGVRAGSIFSTILSSLLVYWLGNAIYALRKTAMTGSMIFLTLLLVYSVGTYAVLDPILLLWLVSAMCSYWLAVKAISWQQRLTGYLLLGVSCAMGFMTKGFLALAVPVLAILPWAISQRRFVELLRYGSLSILVAVLLSAPWALAIYRQESDFWRYFFWVEHIQRFAKVNAQHKAPFWYYFPILLAGSLPWLGLLPGSLSNAWRIKQQKSGALYLLSWILMPLFFFSISKGKLPTYILPCFAPLALLMADFVIENDIRTIKALKINGWINLFTGVLAVLILLLLGPWIGYYRLYSTSEYLRLGLAILAFSFWGILGWLSRYPAKNHWWFAAFCPFGVVLLFETAMPETIQNIKQPQYFVNAISSLLTNSRYVLVNHSGLASTIAWQKQRCDIIFYGEKGELFYGLSYNDTGKRFIEKGELIQWLQKHQQKGNIALVLMSSTDEKSLDTTLLPKPDKVYHRGRLIYYGYNKTS